MDGKFPQIDAGGQGVAVACHSPRAGGGIGMARRPKGGREKRGQGISVEGWKE